MDQPPTREHKTIWAIGGGKGGSGKSFITANIGICLSKLGVRVLLIDADLGGANLHTLLGISPPALSLADYIKKGVLRLREVLLSTDLPNLQLLTGAQDLPESQERRAEVHMVKSPIPSPPEAPPGHEPLVYRGHTLRQIRERCGINLKTVSSQTRITPKIRESVEEETLDKLPPEVYLKGFLRAYAQCLGLAPKKVIDGYLRFVRETAVK